LCSLEELCKEFSFGASGTEDGLLSNGFAICAVFSVALLIDEALFSDVSPIVGFATTELGFDDDEVGRDDEVCDDR